MSAMHITFTKKATLAQKTHSDTHLDSALSLGAITKKRTKKLFRQRQHSGRLAVSPGAKYLQQRVGVREERKVWDGRREGKEVGDGLGGGG